jgi:electron transport complex protein RnfC
VTQTNAEGLCIIIQAEPGSTETAFMPPLDGFTCSRQEALSRIRSAGIIGMGGAGFPAHVKLDPPPGKKAETLIANGAECEPYLRADEALMEARADRIVIGMAIAMRASGCARGLLALEDNKARLLPALEAAVKANARGADIAVRLVKTKYPQGGEKMLIVALTGKEVPSGGLPVDVGCIVQNVGTLAAIADAFIEGKPLIDRILTVAGACVKESKNVLAPIGLLGDALVGPVAELLRDPRKIVYGGPMMGFSTANATIPVQKNTSGLLFLTEAETDEDPEGNCIRCGRCMRVCSCRLSPALINAALNAGDLALAETIGLMDCVDCATCAWVCPARIRLVQRFRVGKQLVNAKRRKEAARGN